MNKRNSGQQDVASKGLRSDDFLRAYALESFAKEIDLKNQTELLTKLILDHSLIARRLEQLNKELLYSRSVLAEAQEIARLGRWDIYPAQGNIIWSQSMYTILDLDSSEPASSDLFFSLVHPDDLQQVNEMFEEMLVSQKPWTARYRLLTGSGTTKWVHVRFYSEYDSKGNPAHLYGTIQDVTELKIIEDELEEYNQHLERLVEEKVEEISASQMATIYALVGLAESRDDDTGAHIERTASFCRLLAMKARSIPEYADAVNDTFIETIYKSSPLHDIGKVGISDSILLKPGKLTDEEFTIMKTHVQIGYDTLFKVVKQYNGNEFLKMGAEIALYHHEKWNGSGYNKGLREQEIPLSARIMAISDVYDALRSKRVYKDAFSHEKSAKIIISSRGSHFDPSLVDLFIQHQEEFRSLYESIS